MNKAVTVNNWDSLPVVLTLQTVCLIFGCSEPTIKRMIYNGELQSKKIGNKWLFEKEYIKHFVSEV